MAHQGRVSVHVICLIKQDKPTIHNCCVHRTRASMVPNLVKCRKRRRTYRSSLTEGPLTMNNIELFRETLALIENDDRLEQLTGAPLTKHML